MDFKRDVLELGYLAMTLDKEGGSSVKSLHWDLFHNLEREFLDELITAYIETCPLEATIEDFCKKTNLVLQLTEGGLVCVPTEYAVKQDWITI